MRLTPLLGLLLLAGCAASPTEGPAVAEGRAIEGRAIEGRAFGGRASDEAATLPIRADGDGLPEERAPGPIAALPGRTGNPWIDCYRRFRPSDAPAADLAQLTAACGERAGLVAVTPIHRGTQGANDPTDRLRFRARRGRCYRAFAVGAPSITDLDVAIFDPQGSLVAGDLTRDRWSVVPPRGPLCAPRGGVYTLEIAVPAGQGEYLLQVFGSQDEPTDDEDDGARD